MKRVFAIVLAAACIIGSTPSFARGGGAGGGHGFGRGGFTRNPTTLLGASPAPSPGFQSRIPAPLAAPSQAPVINGPSARSPYGGVM
jgi:hypothetical protein